MHTVFFDDFTTTSGIRCSMHLSWQQFGLPLGTAPVILINHALTGNSHVTGEGGWWRLIVGPGLAVDTNYYTILSYNIPGNGYDGFFVENYQDFCLKDMAALILKGLASLGVKRLFAIIGGSVGGALGWELVGLRPGITEHFIPIATHYKTTDWLYGQCRVQQFLLDSPQKPLEKARMHAMLCYRTPISINQRFNNGVLESGQRRSDNWLEYHGQALNERFSLASYKLMNHLLMHFGISENQILQISAQIHVVGINSDLFFPASDIRQMAQDINLAKNIVQYHEILSDHGHDAFLMEHSQVSTILKNIL